MFDRLGRFRLKVPELFTPASASIQYLLKHCLPLRTRPGVAAVCFLQFIYAKIDHPSLHVVFTIEASYLVNPKHAHPLILTPKRERVMNL